MTPRRSSRPQNGLLPLALLAGCCVLGAVAWWPILAVATLAGRPVPANPAALVVGLARHTVAWPGPMVLVLYAAEAMLLGGVLVGLLAMRARRGRGRARTDTALTHLAGPGELVGLTPTQVAASAARLRPTAAPDAPDSHGVLIGETVRSRMALRMSWEDNLIAIAGTRVGKTTTLVVPAIVAHDGPVKTSSNKADAHDATRGVREARGRVWACDPQRLVDPRTRPSAAGQAAFWWDALADVTSLALARELVQILIDTTVDRDARPDAYFHPTGRTTLVHYVFAAALAGASLLDVAAWLADINDTEPARILEAAGYPVAAGQIRSVLAKPERQRDGIIGTAQSWLDPMTDPAYATWITPPAGPAGSTAVPPRFDPAAFVRSSGDTLYLLSQEGPASAAFITTALNAAVDRAAISYARTQPGRRLAVPLLSVLDEAANTIRDRHLPEKFSHYGSRGLATLVMLQSWSQGVDVWRERGMKMLWSAANIAVYAGGVTETDFLKQLSDLVGDRDDWYWTRGGSRDARGSSASRSEQVRRLPVLSVAELAALPRGRALVFSSGNRPALVRPIPWMNGPHATAITASLTAWEPELDRHDRLTEAARAGAEIRDTEARDPLLHQPGLTGRPGLAERLEQDGVLL